MSSQIKYHTCSLCEATCGIEVEVHENAIVSIRGDKQDAFSRGHICPKAAALQDVHADPDRLRKPVRKIDGTWKTIGWDEAFEYAAQRLKEIRARHGANAIGVYLGNPGIHNYGAVLYRKVLVEALGTQSVFSAASLDQLAHHVVAWKLFGHQYLMPVPDLDRTQMFVMLGANPLVSNGSIMTVPDVRNRLKAIQTRGGKVVTVDPRFNETSKLADQHVFIKPGTDALLVLSMIHVLFAEGLTKPGRLAEIAPGLDAIEKDVANYPPEAVSAATGIAAETIRTLVREMAASESAALYGRMGASVQKFGTLTQYLITVFNLLTGNLDRPGGVMFTTPAANPLPHGPKGEFGLHHTSVRGLPDFGGYLPSAALAEEILTEGPGRIRAMVQFAGNPVISAPNGRHLERAYETLEFNVSIDFYITESNCNADIILPPTMGLERDHYDVALNMLAIRNVAKYAEPAVEPAEDSRHDWEILAELAQRLVAEAPIKKRISVGLMKNLGPQRVLDLILRTSAYGGKLNPFKGLTLKRLKAQVHGMDFGPLQPVLPGYLQTESGAIELSRDFFMPDLERLARETAGTDPDALLLIGRRGIRSCNSWLHNSHRLVKGKPACTAMMHPRDAASRGIAEGNPIEVASRVGTIEVPVEITEEIMPGVISVPHGWGHHREGVGWKTAEAHAGVSVNDVTDDQLIDELNGAAVLNGIPVQVRAAAVSRQPRTESREASAVR